MRWNYKNSPLNIVVNLHKFTSSNKVFKLCESSSLFSEVKIHLLKDERKIYPQIIKHLLKLFWALIFCNFTTRVSGECTKNHHLSPLNFVISPLILQKLNAVLQKVERIWFKINTNMLDFSEKWRSGKRSGWHWGGERFESMQGWERVVSGELWCIFVSSALTLAISPQSPHFTEKLCTIFAVKKPTFHCLFYI